MSQSAQATRTIVNERQERDYQREQDYYRFEELTNISERLSIPIETEITFFRGEDGKVYSAFGDRVVDVVEKGYNAAREVVQHRPDIAFEVERRGLELDEAHTVETLQDGEVLMVITPIPDAVRNGQTTIGGYQRDRLRSMVRLYQAQGDVIKSVTLSLDKSDYEGLQAVAAAVGEELPDGLGSEEILSRRHRRRYSQAEFEWLPAHLREAYDKVLAQKFGGTWYGGTGFATKQDALGYIQQQPDLIDEHMAAIAGAFADEDREQLRQRFAAAVDARFHGNEVNSLNDAVVSDTLGSGDYSGDCPTGIGGTEGQMAEMGMQQGDMLKCVTCPFCKATVDAIKTPGGIKCPECEVEVKNGKVIDHKADRQKQESEQQGLGRAAITASQKKLSLTPQSPAPKRQQGSRFKEEKFTGIGSEITKVIDTETGRVVAEY